MKARSLPSCRSRTSCRSLPGRRRAFTASLLNDYRSFWVRPFAAAVGWPRSFDRRGRAPDFPFVRRIGRSGPTSFPQRRGANCRTTTVYNKKPRRTVLWRKCCKNFSRASPSSQRKLHRTCPTRGGGPLQSASGRAAVLAEVTRADAEYRPIERFAAGLQHRMRLGPSWQHGCST
jgi:hypothetical protein